MKVEIKQVDKTRGGRPRAGRRDGDEGKPLIQIWIEYNEDTESVHSVRSVHEDYGMTRAEFLKLLREMNEFAEKEGLIDGREK